MMEVTETSALIEMYAKCGSMLEAQQVFAIRQARSLIEWTSLILGCAWNNETVHDLAQLWFQILSHGMHSKEAI